jgi:hypothetical protein
MTGRSNTYEPPTLSQYVPYIVGLSNEGYRTKCCFFSVTKFCSLLIFFCIVHNREGGMQVEQDVEGGAARVVCICDCLQLVSSHWLT